MAYIDVDKFAEKICDFQAIDEDCANKMIWLLRTFSTADVVEVKHGYWIKTDELAGIEFLKCSVCGKAHPRVRTEYCCDCGAKMDGERKCDE